MGDLDYEQLLTSIRDGDMLKAHLKMVYPRGTRTPEQQFEMDELDANLSFMRARKHLHELKMLAETTGSTLPEYDSAALTKPIGDAIRERMENIRQVA